MTSFYTILTNYGKTALAEALAAQQPLEIPYMAVGDGGGAYYEPVEEQTNLRNERWRGDLNDLRTDSDIQGQVIAEAIIPMGIEGDWTVREIGLFDAKGSLIAVGKYPENYIPPASSGAKSQIHISIIINVDNVAAVQLIVDHGQVLASKLYVLSKDAELRGDLKQNDGSTMINHHGDSVSDYLSSMTKDNIISVDALPQLFNTFADRLQYAFDQIPAYGSAQDTSAFQSRYIIKVGAGDYVLNKTVSVRYKNDWKLQFEGRLIAADSFNADSYMLEFICCSRVDLGDIFIDANKQAKYGIRISGDGIPSENKRNSTNIRASSLWFRSFLDGGVALDTLPPTGIFGDYSIDDSRFEMLDFLGCQGSAMRFASSEITVNNAKFSFCGDYENGTTPVISLGNGTSLLISKTVCTNVGPLIDVVDNASIGRVSLGDVYLESAWQIYKQKGGVIRSLNINEGYFAAGNYKGSHPKSGHAKSIDFITLSDCYANVYMGGAAWQDSNYKTIRLGDTSISKKAMLHWAQSSGLSSWKMYTPKAINGVVIKQGASIQNSISNEMRFACTVDAHDAGEWLDLYVDTGGNDEPWRYRFTQLADAFAAADQLGVTKCRINLTGGQHVSLNRPVTVRGIVRLNFYAPSNRLTLQNSGDLTVNGSLEIYAMGGQIVSTNNHGTHVNNGATLIIHNAKISAGLSACCLLNGGRVSLIDVSQVKGDFATFPSPYVACSITVSGTSSLASNAAYVRDTYAQASLLIISSKLPQIGYFPKGAMCKRSPESLTAGSAYAEVCVESGSQGRWVSAVTLG